MKMMILMIHRQSRHGERVQEVEGDLVEAVEEEKSLSILTTMKFLKRRASLPEEEEAGVEEVQEAAGVRIHRKPNILYLIKFQLCFSVHSDFCFGVNSFVVCYLTDI